jgi:hypothetical protein
MKDVIFLKLLLIAAIISVGLMFNSSNEPLCQQCGEYGCENVHTTNIDTVDVSKVCYDGCEEYPCEHTPDSLK